jgi:hypothetical protein
MTTGNLHAWFLAATLAFLGAWTPTPQAMGAGSHLATSASAIYAERLTAAPPTAADYSISHTAQEACCDLSPLGCCAPCVLLPTEALAPIAGGASTFASALPDSAAGLPPAGLKRPPRFAL